MAALRKEGASFSSIAREFGTTYELVRRVISHVEQYDRGMQILQKNPASLEGLELSGVLHPPAAKSLYARGYQTLHDLGALTLVDFLVMQSVLIEQDSDRTGVLVELSLTEYQAVVGRLAEIKAYFRSIQRNNTFCVGQRGRFLKSGFLCNKPDFDVMILAKSPSESISSNIADIAEFSEEPLRSALSTVVDTLSEDAINAADTTCVRFVFRDSDTNEIRQDIPAIVVVTLDQMQSANEDLQACLR